MIDSRDLDLESKTWTWELRTWLQVCHPAFDVPGRRELPKLMNSIRERFVRILTAWFELFIHLLSSYDCMYCSVHKSVYDPTIIGHLYIFVVRIITQIIEWLHRTSRQTAQSWWVSCKYRYHVAELRWVRRVFLPSKITN